MGSYFEKIVELRKKGMSIKQISKELDCATSTVSYHCKIAKLGGYSDRLTEDEKLELQKLYNEVGSLKKVAKIKGHSFETVKKYISTSNKKKPQSPTESVTLWRKRVKLKLIEYKGGKCELCGYNKCSTSLHFHHKNPNEKDFSISGKSLSFEKLKKEVDKCILVCSNCHGEIHEGVTKITGELL